MYSALTSCLHIVNALFLDIVAAFIGCATSRATAINPEYRIVFFILGSPFSLALLPVLLLHLPNKVVM